MPRVPAMEPIPGTPLLFIADGPGTLAAADLHLGYEGAMAARGLYLPPRKEDPGVVLARAARETGSRRIVLLGDVKHRFTGPTLEEGFDIQGLFRTLLEVVESVEVCPGNHDGGLGASGVPGVTFHDPRGFVSGEVGFIHGHTWPDPALLGCRTVVMGHSHPAVWFIDPLGTRAVEPCWLRAKMSPRAVLDQGVEMGIYPDPKRKKKTKGAKGGEGKDKKESGGKEKTRPVFRRPPPRKRIDLLVMPPMSPHGSGCAVNHSRVPMLGPLGRTGLVDIGTAGVYLLNGVHLGRVGDLPPADELRGARSGEDSGKSEDEGAGDEDGGGGWE